MREERVTDFWEQLPDQISLSATAYDLFILEFELRDDEFGTVFYKGQIGFSSPVVSDILLQRLNGAINLLRKMEQEFVGYQQRGTRITPVKLWKIEADSCVDIGFPESISKAEAEFETNRIRLQNLCDSLDGSVPFTWH